MNMAESMTFNEFSAMSGYAYTGVKIADYIANQKGVQFSGDNLTAILAHDKDMCVMQGGRTGIKIRVLDRERRKTVFAGMVQGDWGGWKTISDKIVGLGPQESKTYTLSETGVGYDHDVLITLMVVNPESTKAIAQQNTTPLGTQTTMLVPADKAGGDGATYAYEVVTTDVNGITKTVLSTGKQSDALVTFDRLNANKSLTQVQLVENGRVIKTGSGGYTPPDKVNTVVNSNAVNPEDKGTASPLLADESASSPIMGMPGIEAVTAPFAGASQTVQNNIVVVGVIAALGALGAIIYAWQN